MSAHTADTVVIGVGCAGVNAVSRLMDVGLRGVRFVAADTSLQTLQRADGATCVPLDGVTRGLGTGGDTRLGAAAAVSAERRLLRVFLGADIVFVVAGLAGGTGGGAAPEIARIARRTGALALGFGIEPFAFEAAGRIRAAKRSGREFARSCDTYIPLDSGRTLDLAGSALGLDVALRVADDIVRQAVQGITDLIADCGLIDLDLAAVRRLLCGAGEGCLALGVGRGENPAARAMTAALSSPLADMSGVERARSVLVQITGGPELEVADTAGAADALRVRLAPDCEMVVGVSCDPVLAGAAQVTVLGVGIDRAADAVRRPAVLAAATAAATNSQLSQHASQRASERPARAAGILARLKLDLELAEPVAQAV